MCFMCLTVLFAEVKAQQCARLDSLRRILRLTKDIKVHINTLNLMAAEYAKEDPDGAALNIARRALDQSKKYKHQEGEADALINIGLIDYQALTEYEEAIKDFEDALAIYKKMNDKEKVARTQEIIGKYYFDLFSLRTDNINYKNSLKFYQQALKSREDLGQKKQMAKIHEIISELHGYLNQDQKAIDNLEKAMAINESIGESKANNTRLIAKYKSKYQKIQRLEQQVQYLLIACGALLVILIVTFIVTNARRKKNAQQSKEQAPSIA